MTKAEKTAAIGRAQASLNAAEIHFAHGEGGWAQGAIEEANNLLKGTGMKLDWDSNPENPVPGIMEETSNN